MIGRNPGWQKLRRRWIPALIFCALNVGIFSFYLVNFAGDGKGLERRLGRSQSELATVEGRVGELEKSLALATANQQNVQDFYQVRLATEEERLTAVIAEVKRLAKLSGLDPRRITYPTEAVEDFDLVKRTISFPVAGTYSQLRKMINLLELSDYFLTLRQVQLREADNRGASLRLQLNISTLFAVAPDDVALVSDTAGGFSG